MERDEVQAGVSGVNDLRNSKERKQKIFRSRRDRMRYEVGNSERSWCARGASREVPSSRVRNGRQREPMRGKGWLRSKVCAQGMSDKLPSFAQPPPLTKGSTVLPSCCYLCISRCSVPEEGSHYGLCELPKYPINPLQSASSTPLKAVTGLCGKFSTSLFGQNVMRILLHVYYHFSFLSRCFVTSRTRQFQINNKLLVNLFPGYLSSYA